MTALCKICPDFYTIRKIIGCQLVLITNNSKLYMGFRLILSSTTSNDLGRRNSPYFAFFSPNSIAYLYSLTYTIPDRQFNLHINMDLYSASS